MKTHGQIEVTLSDELFESLRAQAREMNIPLKWLVAGLVCDTIDPVDSQNGHESRRATRNVA